MGSTEDPLSLAKKQLSDSLIDTNTINEQHFIPLVLLSTVPLVVSEVYTRVRSETISRYLKNRLGALSGSVSVNTWRSIACSPLVLNKLRSTKTLTPDMFGGVSSIFPNYKVDKLAIIYIVMFSSFSKVDRKVIYEDESVVALRTKVTQLEKLCESRPMDKDLLMKIFVALSEK